jgi:uncharacterized protein
MLLNLYVFIVFVLSSFLQTTTGFGYAIITAPLLALALGSKETVMLTMLTGLLLRLFMLRVTRNDGSFKEIMPLTLASILGAVPGAYLMTIISNENLKLFIGVVLFFSAVVLWKGYRFSIRRPRVAEAILGGVSGFLATTTSVNGPPIVLYFLNAKAEENKNAFRGNLTRYFLLINIVSLFMSYVAGTLKIGDLWLQTVLSAPAICIGFYLGEKFFYRIDAETFRKLSLGIVFLGSAVLIGATMAKYCW